MGKYETEFTVQGPDLNWICLRTHPKREHIAAAHVRLIRDVEVYAPRVRYEKITRRGKVWFTESLFPNYLFARLNLTLSQRAVACAQGIAGIVRFGLKPSIIPDRAIEELRSAVPLEENVIHSGSVTQGSAVIIGNPMFLGLRAIVTQVLPAKERIKVLLEFLGRCQEVEISLTEVLADVQHILAA